MNKDRSPFPWPLLAVATVAALAAGYALGSHEGYEEGRRWGLQLMESEEAEWLRRAWEEQADLNGSKAQTKDAMQRWLRKNGGRGMRDRYPYVTYARDMNCIQFRIAPFGVGGEPTYCYRANTLQLIKENSDVQ